MFCRRCTREIADNAAYCAHCGASQRSDAGPIRLERSVSDRQLAGICGGLAAYIGLDATLVRVLWIVLSVVPGAIIFGIIAYLAAWLIIPEAAGPEPVSRSKRLTRSLTDARVAGVCGGLAEYFDVDPTPIRFLWVVLSIYPGAVIGGVIVYGVAWLVPPLAPLAQAPPPTTPPPTPPSEPVEPTSRSG